MRKIPAFVMGLIFLFIPRYASAAEPAEYAASVPDNVNMYESSTVDMSSGRPRISYAHWEGADIETALSILERLSVSPRWPSLFPEGFNPNQEPLIRIMARRPKDDFSEYRVGDMLSSKEEEDGTRVEYWKVSASLFSQPSEISVYFFDEEKETFFCLRYNLWTPENIADHPFLSSDTEVRDTGVELYAFDYHEPWKQVYLLETGDAQSIREGNRSDNSLMIFYRLLSTNMELETLKEVAGNLAPYEDALSKP